MTKYPESTVSTSKELAIAAKRKIRRYDLNHKDTRAVNILRDVARQNADDPKFAANINAAADQLNQRIRTSSSLKPLPIGVRIAQQALDQYKSDPGKYAKEASLPAENGYKPFPANDTNGADNKCNIFVANMVKLAGGSFPSHRYGDYRDLDPRGGLPALAENIYANGNMEGMKEITGDQARVGDIICFPGNPTGHIGIYLGNGVYIDAKAEGVTVSKVPWGNNPRFRRVEEREYQRSYNSPESIGETQLTGTVSNNNSAINILAEAKKNLELIQKEYQSVQVTSNDLSTRQQENQDNSSAQSSIIQHTL